MPSVLSYPGVYVEELPSPVHSIAGVATSIAAFVGYTARGIDNRATELFSFPDFERLFGGLAPDSELSYAVQQFFNSAGGGQAIVVRTPRPGAKGAQVTFGGLTFTALSSGVWADGTLLIDVDTIGIDTSANPKLFNLTITDTESGVAETFPSVSADPASNRYVLAVVDDVDAGSRMVSVALAGGALTAAPAVTGLIGTAIGPTAATLGLNQSIGAVALTANSDAVTGTSTAFTKSLKVGQFLVFASDSTATAYKVKTITDDTHLAIDPKFAGTAATTQALLSLGPVQVTGGSTTVTGTGTAFTTAAALGQTIVFAADPTQTPYKIAAITTDTALTIAPAYVGANAATSAALWSAAATRDGSVVLSVSQPATAPMPLPLTIKLFSAGGGIPQSLAGLAVSVGTAINRALTASWPGAYVTTGVVPGAGKTGSIRINAFLPNNPDAILTILPSGGDDTAVTLGFSSTPLSTNVAHYALGTGHAWGQQTAATAGSDGSGLPATAQLIGDEGLFTGIYALEKVDLFNLLSIPDATRAAAGDPFSLDPTVDPNSVYAAALTLCKRRRAMLLVDCPPPVRDVSTAYDWKSTGLTVHDENGIAFFPRLRLPDPLNAYQLRTFAPSGVYAGLYARIDGTRRVWKAPAGIEASLTGVQNMVYTLSDAEHGVLNPIGLNCSRRFPIYGFVSWGARTLVGADADASQWKYVPVRRTALFLEESLFRGLQWVVFEPNDERLWAQIRLNVGGFMQTQFRQGAFQGTTPHQAYFVRCDSSTTTQNDIDAGRVNIVVGFAPLLPAEFVVLQIQQIAGQIDV
jgi:phage tail sheath protein FI